MQKDKKIILEWHSIFRDLKRNIPIVIMSMLIGLMGIYIARERVYSPEYSSTATLVVTARVTSIGRRLTHLTGEAHSKKTGKVIASASSVYINVDTEKEHQ